MATTDDRADTTEAKLEQLQRLRHEAEHAGSERAVERQREQGKLLARERLLELLDPGSFVELDRYVRHRESNFGMLDRRPYGDAVVTGYGTIFGRKVFVFSQDFTVFGGSLSEVFAEKICKVMDLAAKYGCPLIGINDSGGARVRALHRAERGGVPRECALPALVPPAEQRRPAAVRRAGGRGRPRGRG